jgi:hypothetical protein
MFFSTNELYDYAGRNASIRNRINRHLGVAQSRPLNKRKVAVYLRAVKDAIAARQTTVPTPHIPSYDQEYIAKWHRPWDVVPKLANFSAPEGEYAVGVEIELGFTSAGASRTVANFIRNWKYVALDWEGGDNPIEATFPPILYSKFNSQSQPMRYLKFLRQNSRLVTRHRSDAVVGTHVNVSKGGRRVGAVRTREATYFMDYLTPEEKVKYFGRAHPYLYAISQEGGKFIEFKMFNSTTDGVALKRYVNVAVAVAELIYSTETINSASIRAALEKGYNKRVVKQRV